MGVSKNFEMTEGGVSLGLRITNEEALGGKLERGGGVGLKMLRALKMRRKRLQEARVASR